MVVETEKRVSSDVIWNCHRCDKAGQILGRGFSPNPFDKEALDIEVAETRKLILESHQKVSPFCQVVGFYDFDTDVVSVPLGIW